jgi:hypothetical protein
MTHNVKVGQMHSQPTEVVEMQQRAQVLTTSIEDNEQYYREGESTLINWPKETNMQPSLDTTPQYPVHVPVRDPRSNWEPYTPAIPCFVGRHPAGTQPQR